MHLVRIEHREHGIGPYNCGGSLGRPLDAPDDALEELSAMVWRHGDWDDPIHRTPDRDGIGWMQGGVERSAFESLTQLRVWFTDDELRNLERCGFIVAFLMCPADRVRVGRHQVAYEWAGARKVATKLPSEVIE